MTPCNHKTLALLPEEGKRLRCRQCHLTIKADELRGKYCPECFEATGKKQNDFEEIAASETKSIRYRCEECGMIINSE